MNRFTVCILLFSLVALFSFRSFMGEEERETNFIDSEGRAGVLRGIFESNQVLTLSFLSETETGKYREEFTFKDQVISSVKISTTSYNRPKFWTEALARANDDDQWFDPEKSETTSRVYYYSEGRMKYWVDDAGNKNYPVNKRSRKEGESYLKKVKAYLSALEK